ncbi:MAG: bidirectional hydrogenase complex protein HoxE [Deltaproteobacteria bacterium]|nr:bidirectional hydrogenase complex protein HoxE [Deltaproteobacteria bacterium]TLN02410.1 MAG: bidirectional hydrogenase complex protein HoxE [bacterium]
MDAEKSLNKGLADTNRKAGATSAKGTGAALKREAESRTKGGLRDTAAGAAPAGPDSPYIQVDRALKRCQYSQDALIEILHTAQETFGFLGEDTMTYIAHQLKLPLSWVYGVTSFYHHFNLKPQGEHSCNICMGTACFVKRAGEIVETLEREFRVKAGETTADGKLSINIVRCLGNCGLAPMVIMDGKVHARQTSESMLEECRKVLKD